MTPLPPTHQNNTRTGKSADRFSPTCGWLICFRANNHCSTQKRGPKYKTHTNIKSMGNLKSIMMLLFGEFAESVTGAKARGHQNSGLKFFALSCSVLLCRWQQQIFHFLHKLQNSTSLMLLLKVCVTEQLYASWQRVHRQKILAS